MRRYNLTKKLIVSKYSYQFMKVHLIFIFSVIFLLLISGCSAPSPSTTSVTTPSTVSTWVKTPMNTPVNTLTTSVITTVPSPKLATSVSISTGTMSNGVCDCSNDKYNCGDFSTHALAQACYDYCIAQGKGDIHRLDADQNDKACESLK